MRFYHFLRDSFLKVSDLMTLRIKILFLALIACIAFIAVKNIYSCDLSAQIDKGIYKAAKLGEIENLYIGSRNKYK